MHILTSCPICNHDTFIFRQTVKDHSITKETFELRDCEACGFTVTSPRPENNDLPDYYKSEAYISHSATKKGLVNKLYHLIQDRNHKLKYISLKKYVPRGTWMDYGAGNGSFLNYLKGKDLEAVGFEPDDGARKIGAANGIAIRNASEYATGESKYACITMWHVLEHIPELNEIMEQHNSNLLPEGILTIAVPNIESYDSQHYGSYWAALDVPRHLWHFKKKDIQTLATKHGFRLLEVRPMIFDAYYVSLLSEKYKKGNMLYAMDIAMKSNIKAKFSTTNYSSNIFILQKSSL